MDKRQKIIDSIGSEEYKELAAKIIDYIRQVQKYYEVRYTYFLDPTQISVAKNILQQFDDISYEVTSGIDNCERNIIAIFPEAYRTEGKLPIVPLKIGGNFKFESITHRDILGALMNLGIKREKLGDIFVAEDVHFIIAYEDISAYICMNLDRIRNTSVKVNVDDFKNVSRDDIKYKVIKSTVSSLRLDAILSAGYGESRTGISKEIKSGNVKVNWEAVEDLSYSISSGDTISVKGKGRIIVDSVGGITKKGRINIIIKKLI